MHRLFTAIRPPPAIREALWTIMGGVEGARWQSDDQLHLTLRFVGAVDRTLAEDVATALLGVRSSPVKIAVAGVGAFERKGRVDQLWAGVERTPLLTQLHKKIDNALIRLGLPPESRTYLPHITLARFSHGSGDLAHFTAENAGLHCPPFEAGWFGLYESHLLHAGAEYTLIARYPLMG